MDSTDHSKLKLEVLLSQLSEDPFDVDSRVARVPRQRLRERHFLQLLRDGHTPANAKKAARAPAAAIPRARSYLQEPT